MESAGDRFNCLEVPSSEPALCCSDEEGRDFSPEVLGVLGNLSRRQDDDDLAVVDVDDDGFLVMDEECLTST